MLEHGCDRRDPQEPGKYSQLNEHSADEQSIASPAQCTRPPRRAAAGKRICDLADHDGCEGSAGRGEQRVSGWEIVAGSPARSDEGNDECSHLHQRFGWPEYEEDATQQRAIDEVATQWRLGQSCRVWCFCTERESREKVGPDIEGQDL